MQIKVRDESVEQSLQVKYLCRVCESLFNMKQGMAFNHSCFDCQFWQDKWWAMIKGDPKVFRIDGQHYMISDNDFLAMDWSGTTIQFNDGRVMKLKYVSSQGTIPPLWERLGLVPNAKIVTERNENPEPIITLEIDSDSWDLIAEELLDKFSEEQTLAIQDIVKRNSLEVES